MCSLSIDKLNVYRYCNSTVSEHKCLFTEEDPLAISCAFATSLDTPENIVLAEQLGYHRAWCYDSSTLNSDVSTSHELGSIIRYRFKRTNTIFGGKETLITYSEGQK